MGTLRVTNIEVNNIENSSGDPIDLDISSLNSGQLAGFRNQLINGSFAIWQRGTTITNSGSSKYTADHWKETGSTVGAVVQQSTTAPAGFGYSLDADANTGAIQQAVELDVPDDNSQFPIGSTWTFSVWCDIDITSSNPSRARFRRGIGITAGEIEATAGVPNWSSTGETSNGFTRYKTTFTITGDASTSSDIVCFNINLPGGADAGARKFAGVQLEPGPVVTPFEHRPIGTELALCQRYYQIARYDQILPLTNTSIAFSYGTSVNWITEMRATPTVTGTNDQGTFAVNSVNQYGCNAGRSNIVANRRNSGTVFAEAEL